MYKMYEVYTIKDNIGKIISSVDRLIAKGPMCIIDPICNRMREADENGKQVNQNIEIENCSTGERFNVNKKNNYLDKTTRSQVFNEEGLYFKLEEDYKRIIASTDRLIIGEKIGMCIGASFVETEEFDRDFFDSIRLHEEPLIHIKNVLLDEFNYHRNKYLLTGRRNIFIQHLGRNAVVWVIESSYKTGVEITRGYYVDANMHKFIASKPEDKILNDLIEFMIPTFLAYSDFLDNIR